MTLVSPEHVASAPKVNAPPPGIGDDEHAKAWRETGYQFTDSNQCTFCEKYGHGPARCMYLNPNLRNTHWQPDPTLWVYKEGKNNSKLKKKKKNANKKAKTETSTQLIVAQKPRGDGNYAQTAPVSTGAIAPKIRLQAPIFNLVPLEIDALATLNIPRHHWAVILGYFQHITNSKESFVDYHEYTPAEIPYRFRDLTGTLRTAIGVGRVRVSVLLGNRFHNDLIMNAVYCPGLACNIFSLGMARHMMNLWYDMETYSLKDVLTNRPVAQVFEEKCTLFLRTALA